jgi:hypothetical protein
MEVDMESVDTISNIFLAAPRMVHLIAGVEEQEIREGNSQSDTEPGFPNEEEDARERMISPRRRRKRRREMTMPRKRREAAKKKAGWQRRSRSSWWTHEC